MREVLLTYCGNHSDGEIKGAGELPLHPCFVRFQLQHDDFQLLEVLFGQVVFAHELELPGVQFPLVSLLLLRLQGLEHGRSHHQVGEDADDEGEGPSVLPLHGEQAAEARLSSSCSATFAFTRSGSKQRGDFGEGAALSQPPPRHSWVATEFGVFVTDLYLDPAEKEHGAIPQALRGGFLRALGLAARCSFCSSEVKTDGIFLDLFLPQRCSRRK